MADIIPFPRRLKVFDPDLTTTMGNAYDQAMSTLDDRRSELAIRELIAKRIIRMAQSGEVDPELYVLRLCRDTGRLQDNHASM